MNITFTGKQDKLTASQERKLATQFSKLSKLLEKRGEKVAQVALQTVRYQQHAEVRINFHDQALVGVADAADQYTAIMDAASKIEKQALKLLSKHRDSSRDTVRKATEPAPPSPAAAKTALRSAPETRRQRTAKPSRVVKATGAGKPMTAEEAMLTMDPASDYAVFTDSESGRTSVLIRRRDGKVDLIES